MQYSFILMDPLASFPSPRQVRAKLELLKEYGYDGVELNLTEPVGFDLDLLERWLGELGLVVPSFLTGAAYNDGLCLSVADGEVRRRAVERLIGYLDTARRFGAILVVGLLQGLRHDEPDADVAQRRIIEGLRAVADAAVAKGVELVVEPVNHLQVGFNNTVAEVRDLVRAVGSPAIKPMVDTIHMNIEEASLTEPIYACGGQLRHVHLCESNGGRFGSGHVDFASVLRALDEVNYQRFASVKVYRHLEFAEAARSSIACLRGLKI
jgi:sugar phosphate isomerase/epimerase